jgi:hypothetical protein
MSEAGMEENEGGVGKVDFLRKMQQKADVQTWGMADCLLLRCAYEELAFLCCDSGWVFGVR